jgi:membrane protease YdiL (CAAX protease family)
MTVAHTSPPLDVTRAVACAAGQFVLTVAILKAGSALAGPQAIGTVRLVAFASTVVLPLLLAHAMGLWSQLGLAMDRVRPAPSFVAGLVTCVLFAGLGLRMPDQRSIVGEVLFQFANAFGEELLFRGVIFVLLARLSPGRAILLNGAMFGAMHLLHGFMGTPWPDALRMALLTGVAGMMFAAVRHASGSLWLCIALHMLLNLSKVFSNVEAAAGPSAVVIAQRLASGVELLIAWQVARGGLTSWRRQPA